MSFGFNKIAGILTADAVAGFVPSDDGDLISWWDTTDESTITKTGSLVDAHTPKAGSSSLDLIETGSKRPTTGIETINGLNAFGGAGGQHLFVNSFPVPSNGDMMAMAVLNIQGVGSTATSAYSMKATNDFQIDSGNASQFNGVMDVNGIGSDVALTGGPYSGVHIFHTIFDFSGAGTYRHFIDNVAVMPATTYSTKLDASQVFRIFVDRTQSFRMTGSWADIIITAAVDSETVDNHYAYEADKYAI